MITPAQCRAARALLNLTREQLAAAFSAADFTFSVTSISNFEKGRPMRSSNQAKARVALENLGVVFLDPDEMGPGARLRDQEG